MNSSTNTSSVTTAPLASGVEIIEFGDALESGSQVIRKTMCAILNLFKGQRLVYSYRHYPNPDSNESILAAVALEAAGQQGKFWPMYAALFTQPTVNCANLATLAVTLELDQRQFLHDLMDDRIYRQIKTDWQAGHLLGVCQTPTLFIGGQQFHGKLTQARLVSIIQFHLSHNNHSILNTVDKDRGTMYWGEGEWGL